MALHVPLVQEKLGCLIPADLHPRLDGKKPKQNPGAVAAASAVELCCGSWKLKLCEEHALHERRPLPKGLVEFFVRVLERVAQTLELRVFFGNVGLAGRLGSEETSHDFLRTVRGWQSLSHTHVLRAKNSQLVLLLVCRDTLVSAVSPMLIASWAGLSFSPFNSILSYASSCCNS